MGAIPFFSIIIPYYNSALTLSRCINSVLCQSFCDFELILIDDGSTDLSLVVAEFAAQRDSRVFNYRQANRGVSSARNYGISKASGHYLLFIDSDDWVEANYLSSFITFCETQDCLVVQGYVKSVQNCQNLCVTFKEQIVSVQNIFESDTFVDLFKFCAPFGKLYRRDIVSRYRIMFDVSLSYGEDLLFMLDYLSHIKYLRFVPIISYHYCVCNDLSLSNKFYSFECEYRLYINIRQKIIHLTNNFENFQYIYFKKIMMYISRYLMRSIVSIYNGTSNYSTIQRLNFLVIVATHRFTLQSIIGNCDMFCIQYKLVSYFLLLGNFRLLDHFLVNFYFLKKVF